MTGAVHRFDGSLTTIVAHGRRADGTFNPTFRCLYPEDPPDDLPACAEAGILGPVTGLVGTLQALEAIKLVTGAGEPLVGRLLMVNALTTTFEEIGYGRVAPDPVDGTTEAADG